MPRFLLGLSGGLYRFDPSAHPPDPQPVLGGVQALALAVDPAVPTRVYCATYDRGLWRSEDGGDTWVPIGEPQSYFRPLSGDGLGTLATTAVSVAPTPDVRGRHTVWVGTENSRLYKSGDHGTTFALVTDFKKISSYPRWSFPPRPATHHVRWLAHGPNEEVYVSIEYGALLRSFDGGQTFEDHRSGGPLDTHVLRTHPAATGRLYAATGDGSMWAGHSWAESPDRGTTWHYASRGLEKMPYLYGLAVNAGDPDDIRLAASPTPWTAHEHGGSSIYQRVRGTWVEDAAGFPREHSLIPVLAADSTLAGQWYALSNFGFFQKEPGAPAWQGIARLAEWQAMHPTCLVQLA